MAVVGAALSVMTIVAVLIVAVLPRLRRRADDRLRRRLVAHERHMVERRLEAITRATVEQMLAAAHGGQQRRDDEA